MRKSHAYVTCINAYIQGDVEISLHTMFFKVESRGHLLR